MITPQLYIRFFRLRVQSFRFFGVTGYLAGSLLGVWLAWMMGLSIPIILLMSLVGAVVFFLLTIGIRRITHREILVYYHYEIAIALCCTAVLTLLHAPVLPYLDITLLGIGVFLAFGRIGCLSVGCCHGRPWRKGIHYGYDHVSAGFTFYYENIAIFPIQLLESILVTGIVLSGIIVLLNHGQPGAVVILYTVVYGAFRYLLEFFRGDPDRPYWFGLSEAQWTGLLLIGIALAFAEAGYLPLYDFHPICFFALALISGYMLAKRNDLFFKLANPRHIREIARIVYSPDDGHAGPIHAVQIYHTAMGLNISKGRIITRDAVCYHYTVSRKDGNGRLSERHLRMLASVIKQLGHPRYSFGIVEKQEGLFQIIFEYGLF